MRTFTVAGIRFTVVEEAAWIEVTADMGERRGSSRVFFHGDYADNEARQHINKLITGVRPLAPQPVTGRVVEDPAEAACPPVFLLPRTA